MEKKHSCYMYAPGQFVAHIRKTSATSTGVTIPAPMLKSMGLRPGMEVMVTIEIAKPRIEKIEGLSEEASQ